MTKIIKEDFDLANEVATQVCGKFLCVTIEVADTILNDLMPVLRKSNIYKHDVKRIINHVCYNREKTGLHDMTAFLRHHSPEPDVYTTYVDACYNAIEKDIFIFRQTLLREMMRCHVENHNIIAELELLRVLLVMSANAFDNIFDDIRKECGISIHFNEFKDFYHMYNVRHIANQVTLITDKVFAKLKHGQHCDLNESTDIRNAYLILQRKYINGEFLNDGATETVAEFQFLKDEYNRQHPDNPMV